MASPSAAYARPDAPAPPGGYRLYSSAVFNDAFAAHGEPEVLATPLEGVALTMRALGIDRVRAPVDTAGPAEPRRWPPRRACARGLHALVASGMLARWHGSLWMGSLLFSSRRHPCM